VLMRSWLGHTARASPFHASAAVNASAQRRPGAREWRVV